MCYIVKVIWSKHARQRARERRIREKEVLRTLFNPDWYEPSHRNRIRVQKRIRGHTLEVIYSEEKDRMVIITCYYL